MSGTEGPAGNGPETYAAALDRLIDGRGPAHGQPKSTEAEQAEADVAAVSRALTVMAAALTDEGGAAGAAGTGSPAAAATGVAGPASPTAGGTVVALSAWRRMNPRVLAAAASLLLILGIGIPVALSTGGSDTDVSASGQNEDVLTGSLSAEQEADTDAAAAPAQGATDAAAPAAPVSGEPPAPLALQLADESAEESQQRAAKSAADDAAAAEAAPADGAAAAVPDASSDAFADAVACARAIVIGQVTTVAEVPDSDRVRVTLLVTEWIEPDSGPTLPAYDVGGQQVITTSGMEDLAVGQRRLFVIPGNADAPAWAYRQSEWPETRERIAAIREERSGQPCP